VNADRPPSAPDEYPQAIADNYPGWGVKHHDGHWTATCPAITVHADTASGLRAAIEHVISPDDTSPGPTAVQD